MDSIRDLGNQQTSTEGQNGNLHGLGSGNWEQVQHGERSDLDTSGRDTWTSTRNTGSVLHTPTAWPATPIGPMCRHNWQPGTREVCFSLDNMEDAPTWTCAHLLGFMGLVGNMGNEGTFLDYLGQDIGNAGTRVGLACNTGKVECCSWTRWKELTRTRLVDC